MLVLHLVVDGKGALHAGLYLIFEAGGVELLAHRSHELLHYLLAVGVGLVDERHYLGILGRVLVAEGEVLEFGFYLEEAEAVGQRRVDV